MSILKRFVQYYKPYQRLFYMDLFCAVIVLLIDLSFPQFLNLFSKGAFIHSPEEYLNVVGFIAVGMIVMYMIRYGCQYYITSWGHVMGAYMESDMRQDLFDISELAHHGPENLFISALKILGSCTILMLMNVKMTLVLLVITLLMVLFSVYQNKKMLTFTNLL